MIEKYNEIKINKRCVNDDRTQNIKGINEGFFGVAFFS